MRGIVLITGGAGFIGSHAAAELLAHGWRVRALDCLDPQVHESGQRPAYLSYDGQLERGEWEPVGPNGERLRPLPTAENKPPSLSSIYALGKYDQERMCLLFGSAYDVPTTALRFFNVYGPHQALSNPYTGVLAIFAARLLNDRPPLVFEDGEQRRDFVYVDEVAEACRLALTEGAASGHAFNIGRGGSA